MNRLETLLDHYPQLAPCATDITAAFQCLLEAYKRGNKLLLCGNGGSAADADHIAGELLKGFQSKRPLPSDLRERLGADLADNLQGSLPAIPLAAFTALGTAYLNDIDAVYTYAQLVYGLGKPGDVLLGISTSGNARNVGLAFRTARALGISTLGLSGETGGDMRPLCDICIRVPSRETYRIQEYHLPIYHTLCLMLEDDMFQQTNA
ncbi:MAG: SIS domain-containing protein [Kiritimatiellae bacterium]|nr:SIS domain-containing protein [Kiritimatiellia bacterium]